MMAIALFALFSIAWVPREDSTVFSHQKDTNSQSSWDAYNAWLGEDVTADLVVKRCLKYRVLIDRWNPDFHLDPALVMAVMAQESHCAPGATDPGGVASVGLMQVIPRSWTATAGTLEDPATNIYWGMRILWLTLNDDKHNPTHDVALALGAYNCGWPKLAADDCGSMGGIHYAERVLGFWLPRIVAELAF
jgi:soluble lytic murein transglycosylase-like protein